jgi:hypothetical protein
LTLPTQPLQPQRKLGLLPVKQALLRITVGVPTTISPRSTLNGQERLTLPLHQLHPALKDTMSTSDQTVPLSLRMSAPQLPVQRLTLKKLSQILQPVITISVFKPKTTPATTQHLKPVLPTNLRAKNPLVLITLFLPQPGGAQLTPLISLGTHHLTPFPVSTTITTQENSMLPRIFMKIMTFPGRPKTLILPAFKLSSLE